MAAQIYVIKNVESNQFYGSWSNVTDHAEQALGPFPILLDEQNPYGFPCDAERALEALQKIDEVNDSCQFRDLLMVFFSAGFHAGMRHKQSVIREELGISQS